MKQKGFTLAEVVLSIVILGMLSAILIPVIRKALPDNNKVMFRKSYSVLEAAISDMINDDQAYPATKNGFSNTDITGTVVPSGFDKFCYLLGEELNLQPVAAAGADDSGAVCPLSGIGYFRTSDGVDWFIYDSAKFLPISTTDDSAYSTRIVIDVNGKNTDPNGGAQDSPWGIGVFAKQDHNCGVGKKITGSDSINSCDGIAGKPTPDMYEIGVRFDGKLKIIDPTGTGGTAILGNPTHNSKDN